MSARFPSAEILRSLGVDQPNLFTLTGRDVLPVITLLDLSRSVSSEPMEARGFAAASVTLSGVNHGKFAFKARAPGGCVVEFLLINMEAGGGGPGQFLLRIQSVEVETSWAVGATAMGVAQVGGRDAFSVPEFGLSAANTLSFPLVPYTDVPFGHRWYVRSGRTLEIHSNASTPGMVMTVFFQWRELPEIQA